MHPIFAADRGVVSTLAQALDIAEPLPVEAVGVVVDTFHVWWDPAVLPQIARAGASGRIASYQVCDWATPLAADVLLSRHYPGDGVIDFESLDFDELQRQVQEVATESAALLRARAQGAGPRHAGA